MNTTEGRTKELPEVTKVYFFKKERGSENEISTEKDY